MSPVVHKLYIASMVMIVVLVSLYLSYVGYDYYNTPIVERFYHEHHEWFKPSGPYGHGLGIIGTFLILFGVVLYIARKRYNFMGRFLRLKYLLEFHIFLCTLGPIMVLFHTSFKFGGIVSVAFWSMVAVVLSGVIGRFIYIQIPRTIEGRELSLSELKSMQNELSSNLQTNTNVDSEIVELLAQTANKENSSSYLKSYLGGRKIYGQIKSYLKTKSLGTEEKQQLLKTVKKEINLNTKIARLHSFQKLFKYWHVAHLPFALIMLIIVVIHVIVTLLFGYTWIF